MTTPDDYAGFAARENAAYAAEYHRWVESLTAAERLQLNALGVKKALLPKDRANDRESDAAECHTAHIDPPTFSEDPVDELMERFGVSRVQASGLVGWVNDRLERSAAQHKAFIIARVVGGLMRPGNSRLINTALAFAADLDQLNGLGTQIAAAKELGVTRAALSKRVNEWTDLLELPRSKHQKKQATRAVFADAQKKNHWRKRKCKATK